MSLMVEMRLKAMIVQNNLQCCLKPILSMCPFLMAIDFLLTSDPFFFHRNMDVN